MRRVRALVASLALAALVAGAAYFTHLSYYTPRELAERAPTRSGETSLVFVGDIMLSDSAAEAVKRGGPLYPFLSTLPLLRGADLCVANLEGPVVEHALKVRGGWSYRVPTSTLTGLREAGIDWVTFANNHALDCGEAGLLETLSELERARIGAFGAGADEREAAAPKFVELGGVRVALLGMLAEDSVLHDSAAAEAPHAFESAADYCRDRLAAGERRPGISLAGSVAARAALADARAHADFVVVVVHWGVRYQRAPSALQRKLAAELAAAGVDLVIGQHAHFWQPLGVIGKTPVVYGTGNFAFGSNNLHADEALLVRAILRERRLVRLELFPLAIRNLHPSVRYQPKVLKGASARGVLEPLRRESRALGAELSLELDRARLDLP